MNYTNNTTYSRRIRSTSLPINRPRARICELKNDHRSIVDQLAQALPLLLPKQGEDCPSPSKDVTTNGSSSSSMVPFAKVDMVTPGSPAEQAGLKLQDQIVRFGPLNSQNHDRLQALGKLVAESEGGTITVCASALRKVKNQ
ncbi:hypothetical protein PSHT_13538 [Puccinia striiformis]|uniref:Probable 26S proteasome regulatory subunit p27 n=1 Tax=Puccinia striiformis TaxID=27350 RepID=A0A2S4UQ62_9BASI|nr:hypothetical protein PSHT_13538 [Puccinia striiformis]